MGGQSDAAYKTMDDQSKQAKNSRKQSRNRGATIKEEGQDSQTFGVKKNLAGKGAETGQPRKGSKKQPVPAMKVTNNAMIKVSELHKYSANQVQEMVGKGES